jgi:hypothetical protein
METYIATVFVKSGHEDEVTRFYQDMEPLMREAKGFQGRQLYRARNGTMAEAVHKLYSKEELARHAEPPHEDPGVQFISVEIWDSVEDRMLFSKNVAGSRTKDLIPHLLPAHSHEFYEDISIK